MGVVLRSCDTASEISMYKLISCVAIVVIEWIAAEAVGAAAIDKGNAYNCVEKEEEEALRFVWKVSKSGRYAEKSFSRKCRMLMSIE